MPVYCDWFPSRRSCMRAWGPKNVRRARPQLGYHGGAAPSAPSQEETGPTGSGGCHFRNAGRETLQVVSKA
jgi:hypothetical protein